MTRGDLAARVSSRYPHRALREYVRWKVRTDPVYEAVLTHLRASTDPILDLGCGVGILAMVLREEGIGVPYAGRDFDARKIEMARRAAGGMNDVAFAQGDARDSIPPGHTPVLLDVLQYLDAAARRALLFDAAKSDRVLIRTGIRDASWRYRVTWAVDVFARASRWMRSERLTFPAREEIVEAFRGFRMHAEPCWGRTPFNNYLFVFTKAG